MSKFDNKLASLDRAGLERLLRQFNRKVRKIEAAIAAADAPAPDTGKTDEELNAALDPKYTGKYVDGEYQIPDVTLEQEAKRLGLPVEVVIDAIGRGNWTLLGEDPSKPGQDFYRSWRNLLFQYEQRNK